MRASSSMGDLVKHVMSGWGRGWMAAFLLCLAAGAMAAVEDPALQAVKPDAPPKPASDKVVKASKPKHLGHSTAKAAEPSAVAAQPAVAKKAEAAPTDDKLSQMALAVHTGRMVCELGNSVTVTPDPQVSGGFVLQMRQSTFRMTPVVTSTGAIRLEDPKAGAVWLQLANKSMLMNSKIGQRMADECQSPTQVAVAEAMKVSPPPSLLDEPTLARK